MPEPKPPLAEFASDTYSQTGEDGIIAEILNRIEPAHGRTKWGVEFGAWDGVHLSNTCRLIREEGYAAVLIEANPKKVEELEQNHPDDRVIKKCQFVMLEGDSTLDAILATTAIPQDFDLLSIDIDSCDWHIWQSVTAFRPRVVCIEFNPTTPNSLNWKQAPDFTIKHGCSPLALCELAAQKGYVLVAATTTNLIFVPEDLADAVLGGARPTLADLRDDAQWATYVFSGFDGEVLTNQPVFLPWHSLEVKPGKFQLLPKFLRRYRDDFSVLQRIVFPIWRALNGWRVRKRR